MTNPNDRSQQEGELPKCWSCGKQTVLREGKIVCDTPECPCDKKLSPSAPLTAREWREKAWLKTNTGIKLAVTHEGEVFYRHDLVDEWLPQYAAHCVEHATAGLFKRVYDQNEELTQIAEALGHEGIEGLPAAIERLRQEIEQLKENATYYESLHTKQYEEMAADLQRVKAEREEARAALRKIAQAWCTRTVDMEHSVVTVEFSPAQTLDQLTNAAALGKPEGEQEGHGEGS